MDKKSKMFPTVRVTSSEYEAVSKFSHDKDLPLGEVIRLAVREYFKNEDFMVLDEKLLDELIKTAKDLSKSDLLEVLEYARYRLKKSKNFQL